MYSKATPIKTKNRKEITSAEEFFGTAPVAIPTSNKKNTKEKSKATHPQDGGAEKPAKGKRKIEYIDIEEEVSHFIFNLLPSSLFPPSLSLYSHLLKSLSCCTIKIKRIYRLIKDASQSHLLSLSLQHILILLHVNRSNRNLHVNWSNRNQSPSNKTVNQF